MGDTPWSFLFEAILRLLLLYVLLLTGLRLMGKRMAGQLSRTDLAGLVSLAAAIGLPILSADRGLLAPVIIAVVVVGVVRLVAQGAARRTAIERAMQGTVITVVQDGVLQQAQLAQAVLSRERLFAQLRGESLEHLGQVRRLYMEASGTFSLVKEEDPQPGLSLLPSWDESFRNLQPPAPGKFACLACGQVVEAPQLPTHQCPHCGAPKWEPAVEATKK